MRCWTLIVVLSCATRVAAQDAMAIVDKAIRVTADSEERLAKQRFTVQSGKATYTTPGGEWPLTREASFAFPDRLAYAVELNLGLQGKKSLSYVLDGLRGWSRTDGATGDLPPVQYQTFREEMNFVYVTSLVPLKDKSTKLTSIQSVPVGGTMAFGVQAERPGMPPVQLYFEPSGKLVKAAYRGTDAGVIVSKEYVYGGYKDFEGIQKPTRATVFLNGRKTEEWIIESYRFPAAMPDAVFKKP